MFKKELDTPEGVAKLTKQCNGELERDFIDKEKNFKPAIEKINWINDFLEHVTLNMVDLIVGRFVTELERTDEPKEIIQKTGKYTSMIYLFIQQWNEMRDKINITAKLLSNMINRFKDLDEALRDKYQANYENLMTKESRETLLTWAKTFLSLFPGEFEKIEKEAAKDSTTLEIVNHNLEKLIKQKKKWIMKKKVERED